MGLTGRTLKDTEAYWDGTRELWVIARSTGMALGAIGLYWDAIGGAVGHTGVHQRCTGMYWGVLEDSRGTLGRTRERWRGHGDGTGMYWGGSGCALG